MTYLVSLETSGRGFQILGRLEAENQAAAQNAVVEMLVTAGTERHRIGKQVSDKTTIHIGINTVVIVLLTEFNQKKADALTAHM